MAASTLAQAPTYSLTKALDDGTQVPGAAPGVLFTGFDSECPSPQDRLLCFEADFDDPVTNAANGIFTVDACGTVTPIAFSTDPAPGGGTFGSLRDQMLSGERVAFRGQGSDGIYWRSADGSGPVTTIADTNTMIPHSTESFTRFFEFGMDGDLVVFMGYDGADQVGLYVRNLNTNTLSVFADSSTPSPFPGPHATLTSLYEPMIRDGRVSVKASDSNGNKGLLTDFGHGLVAPVNDTATAPNGLGQFNGFDESSIDGNQVVFQGYTTGGGGAGVYLYDHSNGTFTAIADETIPRPGGGFFEGFCGNPSLSVANGVTTVIFKSSGTAPSGIWAWIDGTLIEIAAAGDLLDGRTVTSVNTDFPYGIEGSDTAIHLYFADGTQALYYADCSRDNITTLCRADGGDCPCGNEDPSGGCANSSGCGARLRALGSTSIAADNLQILATELPLQASTLFLMSDAPRRATWLDGVLCVGGPTSRIYRLPPVISSGPDGEAVFGPGLVALSGTPQVPVVGGIQAGDTWYLQAYYRDSSTCGNGANATDALAVTFVP